MLPLRLLACLIALLSLPAAAADLVVVVNARSGVEHLSHDEVVNIFLGRYRQLPGGQLALPIDQPSALPERALFYRLLVNKDLPQINAYWARLVFSGKTQPPLQAANPDEVLARLRNERGAVAYIERDQVDARMRVVYELPLLP
jgi:hypothetical protein